MLFYTVTQWTDALASGACEGELHMLYPWERAADGFNELLHSCTAAFAPDEAVALISAPGRTELGGNHTDHQHGRVLAAAICLDIECAVAPRKDMRVHAISLGMGDIGIDLDDLSIHDEEKNASAALIRGVAAGIKAAGGNIGGFTAMMRTSIPQGSGLSSSAAYEVLIGEIFNGLYNGGRFTPTQLALIAQRAETEYFGKPCGLMDQMACATGGAVAMDFNDPSSPAVEKIECDFLKYSYRLFVTDTRASHASLTGEYAAITREMRAVAAEFGREYLREVEPNEFYARLNTLRKAVGDRACLRAMHFFDENERAAKEADAIRDGDIGRFIALMRESARSSELLLQNIWPCDNGEERSLALVLAYSRRILGGRGACRVHGGGFAGTIQALVPNELAKEYQNAMARLMGDTHACRELIIRPVGAHWLNG